MENMVITGLHMLTPEELTREAEAVGFVVESANLGTHPGHPRFLLERARAASTSPGTTGTAGASGSDSLATTADSESENKDSLQLIARKPALPLAGEPQVTAAASASVTGSAA
jgi:hypothetical protein